MAKFPETLYLTIQGVKVMRLECKASPPTHRVGDKAYITISVKKHEYKLRMLLLRLLALLCSQLDVRFTMDLEPAD